MLLLLSFLFLAKSFSNILHVSSLFIVHWDGSKGNSLSKKLMVWFSRFSADFPGIEGVGGGGVDHAALKRSPNKTLN
jgi:hypothetical protein